MLSKTFSAAVCGIDPVPIDVEVNATGQGEASLVSLVGLPDAAVRESRDRVRSALSACGYNFPKGMTLVNLAPADLKKEGSSFDLPIALALLAAMGKADREQLRTAMICGELALDGSLRPVKGCLPMALLARDMSDTVSTLIVPEGNGTEAAVASSLVRVYPVRNLREAVEALNGRLPPLPPSDGAYFSEPDWDAFPDFADVKGQFQAKRALEIAAAGMHNVLLVGPPGTGKSMLAKRLPGILPPMTEQESIETSRIYSVLGLLDAKNPLLRMRPFRSPHHTVSDAGLLGGGSNPQPGEISLAHNGVLFLDELPEFKRNVLETLRQPIEAGIVTVSRAAGAYEFPCSFLLLAAMNPCPCGHFGDRRRTCTCSQRKIADYRGRISGPLLDRIDLHVEVPALSDNELLNAPAGEPSSVIRKRVAEARRIQTERFRDSGISCNSRMEPKHLREFCRISEAVKNHLRFTINELALSARAYDRILRVARTIADLEQAKDITDDHIFEAVNYRSLDRRN